jgi:hypothetical protein
MWIVKGIIKNDDLVGMPIKGCVAMNAPNLVIAFGFDDRYATFRAWFCIL